MTSLRRRKQPQHQQLIAMRQLDLTASPGVTSSGNKMATKMAAADTATEDAVKMAANMTTDLVIRMENKVNEDVANKMKATMTSN